MGEHQQRHCRTTSRNCALAAYASQKTVSLGRQVKGRADSAQLVLCNPLPHALQPTGLLLPHAADVVGQGYANACAHRLTCMECVYSLQSA